LFIGKSNNQIEIQTVLKTNNVEKPVEKIVEKIVEKPVIEYIDKYITNAVEKVVQAEIPAAYQESMAFYKSMLTANFSGFDKIPLKIESIDVNVELGDGIDKIVSKDLIQNTIELELRKIGVKIDKKSEYHLNFAFQAMENHNKTQHIYLTSLNLFRVSAIITNMRVEKLIYRSVWDNTSHGIVGINNTVPTVKDLAEEKTKIFCNKLLEARDN
jgi:hypothetical protein